MRIKRVAVILALIAAVSSIACAAYREEIHSRCTLAKSGALSVYNVTGRIEITRWNGDYIDIRAVKKTSFLASHLKKVKIEIERGADVSVRTVYLSSNARVSVDYAIKIPAGTRLDKVENVTGDIRIAGAAECRAAKTVTGGLSVRAAAGPLRAESVTGDVEVHLARLDGDTFFKTVTGRLDIYLRPGIEADLDASIVTGDIRNDGLQILLGDRWSAKNLHGIIGAGGHTIRMEVVTGGITLHRDA